MRIYRPHIVQSLNWCHRGYLCFLIIWQWRKMEYGLHCVIFNRINVRCSIFLTIFSELAHLTPPGTQWMLYMTSTIYYILWELRWSHSLVSLNWCHRDYLCLCYLAMKLQNGLCSSTRKFQHKLIIGILYWCHSVAFNQCHRDEPMLLYCLSCTYKMEWTIHCSIFNNT